MLCIGAALFERWADNEEDALKIFEAGEVRFIPCHHVKAVDQWAVLLLVICQSLL